MLDQEKRKAFLEKELSPDPEAKAARARRWAEVQRSIEFMNAHYQEFFRQYPDQWVGVYLEELVVVAPTHRELLTQVDALGIPRGVMQARFMNTNRGIRCWTPFRIKRRA